MRDVTDDTFETEVLKADLPIVVDFWAPWCGPCHAVRPILEQLEAEHEGRILFANVNIDTDPLNASQFGVLSIPTAILFEDGDPKEAVVGARPRSYYEKVWAPWLASAG